MSHTPGPWIAEAWEQRDSDGEIIDSVWQITKDGFLVPMSSFESSSDEAADNANLIAAAPDLLEAIEGLVSYLVYTDEEGLIEHATQIVKARAAIAKAKGEA